MDSESDRLPIEHGLHRVSSLAAFFYVALFRLTRSRLRSATTSNPTWVKATVTLRRRAKPSQDTIHSAFRLALQGLARDLRVGAAPTPGAILDVHHGSSTSLNLSDQSVDVVVTSPPYCTRIDYVASVRPELAILGCSNESLQMLRRMTLGNPTLLAGLAALEDDSSPTAARFLQMVRTHPSKASAGYYHRFFETYFRMLDSSLSEMHRVARTHGSAFLVVQDSYYKEIPLDLPRVALELAEVHRWTIQDRVDFPVDRTMAAINPRAREHRETFRAIESVLIMRKPR